MQARYYIGGNKIITPEELEHIIQKESWATWSKQRSVVMPSKAIPKYDLPLPARHTLILSIINSVTKL